jgi:hypothetical protein
MSDQELIRALQELVARYAPPVEARRLSAGVIARDRWRVGLLAGLTALLWLVGIAGVLNMIVCFNDFIVAYSGADPPNLRRELNANVNPDTRKSREFRTRMELHHSLETCLVTVPALFLAALGTVWLVFSSRRATLNQINLSLAEISEQLRQLRQGARPSEGG